MIILNKNHVLWYNKYNEFFCLFITICHITAVISQTTSMSSLPMVFSDSLTGSSNRLWYGIEFPSSLSESDLSQRSDPIFALCSCARARNVAMLSDLLSSLMRKSGDDVSDLTSSTELNFSAASMDFLCMPTLEI